MNSKGHRSRVEYCVVTCWRNNSFVGLDKNYTRLIMIAPYYVPSFSCGLQGAPTATVDLGFPPNSLSTRCREREARELL
jgi:hypothetical protein